MGCVQSTSPAEVTEATISKVDQPSTSSGRMSDETDERYTSEPIKPRPLQPPDDEPSRENAWLLSLEGKKIVRALYDFEANSDSELSFRKDELLEILNETTDWWSAVNVKTLARGYIPHNFVVLYDSLERYEWYHGLLDRKEAENRLMAPGHIHGTFLIRGSKMTNAAVTGTMYALSVLFVEVNDCQEPTKTAKHYRIKTLDNGGCYIAAGIQCNSLAQLVEIYTGQANGLCCPLVRPCPKRKPTMNDLSRETHDHWQIDRNTLTFYDLLGKGQYGEVSRGRWHNTDVAIKSLRKVDSTAIDAKLFLDEASVMKRLHHPNLVTLYAVCSDKQPYYIVTELLVHGNLRDYLAKTPEGRSLKTNQLVDIAVQVAQGMLYIHSNGIIHRDLAARNVLVGDHNHVKIGDFGMAKTLDSVGDSTIHDEKLPLKWTAPEAIATLQFTVKTDVWSFGILLVELFIQGNTPYKGLTSKQLQIELQRGWRHPQPANCPDNVYEIMLFCWKRNPADRPTFEHLADRLENLVDYSGDYQEA